MPKERRDKRPSFDQSRPYPYNSKNADKTIAKTQSLQVEDEEKEWKEARCPVCMEHPHNAVLLICSSYEKGCRPYMCDTSSRHSNCLDQFLKSIANKSSTEHPEEFPSASATYICPLCRGQINRWVIMESARKFMNSKKRSCSMETCDLVGNYSELRKHARREHPYVRPMETDPTRQREWERSERETAIQDLLSAWETGDEFEQGGGAGRSMRVGLFESLFAELEIRRGDRELTGRSITQERQTISLVVEFRW